jgi:hypothetical protein
MQLLQFGDSRFVCLQQAEQIVGFELLHDGGLAAQAAIETMSE